MKNESVKPSRLACEVYPEVFAPVSDTGPSLNEITESKLLCAACIRLRSCRTKAMEVPTGTMGGLTEWERRAMRQARLGGSERAAAAAKRARSVMKPLPEGETNDWFESPNPPVILDSVPLEAAEVRPATETLEAEYTVETLSVVDPGPKLGKSDPIPVAPLGNTPQPVARYHRS